MKLLISLTQQCASYRQMMTLEDLREEFGESRAHIALLKLDVEGYELLSMPDWPDSGALDNVRQVRSST